MNAEVEWSLATIIETACEKIDYLNMAKTLRDSGERIKARGGCMSTQKLVSKLKTLASKTELLRQYDLDYTVCRCCS